MGNVFQNRRINSVYGILFQIPVFIIGAFGLYKLVEIFYYSLTKYDMLAAPTFVGFENFSNIFKTDVIQKCFDNTAFIVCAVAVLLILTAVLPALFIAKLKLPFGLGVMGAFSLISLCAMLPNFFNCFFNGDRYGLINSMLLSNSVINEPILFAQDYAMMLAVLILWLYCLAPVFAITYISARMKHSFLGTAIAVCAIPVLMYSGGGIITGVVGFPSANYSADWLYTIFHDYLMVRYEVGFAYAILIVGIIMLIGWCLAVCLVTYGLWALCKNIRSDHLVCRVFGYITFALSFLFFFAFLYYIVKYLLRAFMPVEELFIFPNHAYTPKNPTLDHFLHLFTSFTSWHNPIPDYVVNTLFVVPLKVIPVCFFVALCSGVGFGAFHAFKRQKLLLLCFIPLLFVADYTTFSKLGFINTYSVYAFEFLSSFEFLIAVFLVYLTTKLVFCNRDLRISSVLVGSLFLMFSFYAIGVIRGIWHSSNAILKEEIKTWGSFSAHYFSGSSIRSGVTTANDLLRLSTTLAVVIIPLALLLTLYLLYQKSSKNLTK